MTIPHTVFRFIFHFARQQWIKFSIITFAFMVWAASETFFPYFLKHIVNTIAVFQGERTGIYVAVSSTIIVIACFWMTDEVFMRLQGILQLYAFPHFRASIREAVFNYVTSHSHEYFASQFAGNMAKKLADLPTSSQAIMEIVCCHFVSLVVFSFRHYSRFSAIWRSLVGNTFRRCF